MAKLQKLMAIVDPKEVYWIRYILEAYDNLFFMRTKEKNIALIEISHHKACQNDIIEIIKDMGPRIGLKGYFIEKRL